MTVLTHTRRLLAELPAEHREALRNDPIGAINAAGITIRDVPELSGGDTQRAGSPGRWCDGLTLHEEGLILIAPTSDSRRQWFTLLHEYAHILIDDDEQIVDWLADRPSQADDREVLCDEIAGRLLLPDNELDAVIGAGPIRAEHLQELHRRNPHASQMACAVAVARRLPCTGAVLLTDRAEQRLVFAAINGELHPRPRRNTALPDSHPLRRVAPEAPLTTASFWAHPWGGDRRPVYLDATASARRTYSIVLVNDIWGISEFHPEQREAIPAADRLREHRRCTCGVVKVIYGWPCQTCGQVPCPGCDRCDCPAATQCLSAAPAAPSLTRRETSPTGCARTAPEPDKVRRSGAATGGQVVFDHDNLVSNRREVCHSFFRKSGSLTSQIIPADAPPVINPPRKGMTP